MYVCMYVIITTTTTTTTTTGWFRGGMRNTISGPSYAGCMDLVFELILIGGLVFFTAWLSILSNRLANACTQLENGDDQLDEIRESVEIVAQILTKLPEMLPQFHMNNSPTEFLKPIVEAFVSNLGGPQPLMSYDSQPRDAGGQYGTRTEEKTDTKASTAND